MSVSAAQCTLRHLDAGDIGRTASPGRNWMVVPDKDCRAYRGRVGVNADSTQGMVDASRIVTIPELSAPTYLQSILSITYRDEGNSVPLTVVTPGGVVFGNAVHPSAWLRRLGEQLRGLTAGERNEAAEAMARMFEEMAEERTEENPGPDIPMKDIRWIYFTDALVAPVSNATPAYRDPACWQVALRDVTAWTIGLPPD